MDSVTLNRVLRNRRRQTQEGLVCVYVCLSVCMYVYLCICMCVSVCMCAYVCMYVYICVYMFMYIYMYYMYVYMCVCVCICVYAVYVGVYICVCRVYVCPLPTAHPLRRQQQVSMAKPVLTRAIPQLPCTLATPPDPSSLSIPSFSELGRWLSR